MKREVKEKWVAALRSGDYQQGQSALRYHQGEESFFCCLGVLCEVARLEGVEVAVTGQPYINGGAEYAYDGAYSILPPSVVEWAGLSSDNPEVARECEAEECLGLAGEGCAGCTTDLASLNDDGAPFSTIADVIEEQL